MNKNKIYDKDSNIRSPIIKNFGKEELIRIVKEEIKELQKFLDYLTNEPKHKQKKKQ